MDSLPYIPGLKAAEPGPLSRFLPPLEDGTVSTWLSSHVPAHSWLLDPFGFSPKLVVETARAGYRVLVTVNNPITHFLLELTANPPTEADFKAALADLAVSKKGEERLEAHLQSLYLTRCENCRRELQAEAFLWRKGEEAPFARIYECKDCGDKGERAVEIDDIDRAKRLAATDGLHRSRALERVASLDDEDRIYAEEAIQHYYPRPLYVLTTMINRLESLNLNPDRQRALTALILTVCDAGNALWGHPTERPRPKALLTPNQFREHNLWRMLETGLDIWTGTGAPVPYAAWPGKIPESGGICIYEGRLKGLAQEVKKEIPIAAVIGSVPRPNQAFWTLSALWAGWLWGKAAVQPYKPALRRRRYDWAWNATALKSTFTQLFDLAALGTPFFGLMPEAEPPFLTSVLSAASATSFDLKSLALRTEHDPIQILWERGVNLKRESSNLSGKEIAHSIEAHLIERGEPASYLHVHTAALLALTDAHALKQEEEEFDATLRRTHTLIETVLKEDDRFAHFSSGEGVDTGLWGLKLYSSPATTGQGANPDSLTDRVEVALVNFLQKKPDSFYIEIEVHLYGMFPGLLTPSKGMIYAVLSSYAEKDGANWRLRIEDQTASRQEDVNIIGTIIETIGARLKFKTRKQERWIIWEEKGKPVRVFYLLASALIERAIADNPYPSAECFLVIPGGRAALVAYKQQRDPALAKRMEAYRIVKYRTWRGLAEVGILTRDSFIEQLAADPIEKAQGQIMMF